MTLARLRRSSRVIAFVLLVSFWGLAHRDADDACLTGVFETHDESKHAVGAPAAGGPDHCLVCHSVRSPRRPFGPAAVLQTTLVDGDVVDEFQAPSRRAPALDGLPARAPPATLT